MKLQRKSELEMKKKAAEEAAISLINKNKKQNKHSK